MPDKINHTRIKKTCKKWIDSRISAEVYPIIEKFLIKELIQLIENAKLFMNATKRITLMRNDLQLSERHFENGKERNFTDSEIRKLIKENIDVRCKIGRGVIETVRGFITERLMEKMLKAKKALIHSEYKMLMPVHVKLFIDLNGE